MNMEARKGITTQLTTKLVKILDWTKFWERPRFGKAPEYWRFP